MAKQKKDASLLTMQTLQQELLQLSCEMQMADGTSEAWKHIIKAAQHCTLALLWKLQPDSPGLGAELDKFKVLSQHSERGGADNVGTSPPPLVKRA